MNTEEPPPAVKSKLIANFDHAPPKRKISLGGVEFDAASVIHLWFALVIAQLAYIAGIVSGAEIGACLIASIIIIIAACSYVFLIVKNRPNKPPFRSR